MRPRPVVPRERASRDIDEAVDHYLEEGAPQAALDFVDALEKAFDQIGRHPAMGSPRHAVDLNLPGLCCWHLNRYPYLVFYVERPDYVDVWRVLHERRDVPDQMQEGGTPSP